MTGSASRVIRIRAVVVTMTILTAAAQEELAFITRSSADTGGTGSAITPTPLDSLDPTATGTCMNYTAAPTTGTPIGTVLQRKVPISLASNGAPGTIPEFDFGTRFEQDVALRGASQQFAINLSASANTVLADVTVIYTEESF